MKKQNKKAKKKFYEKMYAAIMSEKALAKDWLSKEEDERWKHLQRER